MGEGGKGMGQSNAAKYQQRHQNKAEATQVAQ